MPESKPKRISLSDNSFEAGGEKFIIHSTLNVARYRVLDELQLRAAYGVDYAGLFRGYTRWVQLKNEQKPFDADVHLRNIFEGVQRKVNNQNDPMLLICTLFCDPVGSDRTKWDEETANERIQKWSDEGYPVEDFFALGLRFVKHYQHALLSDFLNTSEKEEETNQ
jgi:hypothetical protein